jgi:signal peptidase I
VQLSPFWADVLRPAFHALAPEEPVVVARRVRNACVGAAFLAALLPRYGPLGTGTVQHANILVGVYAVAAVIAHLRREHEKGDSQTVGVLIVAGLGPLALSGGTAWWGMVLGLVGAVHLAASHWRRSVELPPPPFEADPLPKPARGFPVFLGGIAYSLATILVFWTLVTQHTKVPTGSMQPTILGDHGPMGRYGGDRLLADHMIYMLREPKRFEIVVFRYPLRRDILFVKRLVGLPGEKVEIRGGDIWVDGVVARKPPLVQESLWQEIFPRRAAAPSARPKDVANAWRASEDDGWRKAGDDALRIKPRDGKLGVAAFRDRLTVHDVRVGFDAAPASDDSVAVLRVKTRGRMVTMEVPVSGSGSLQLEGEDAIPLKATIAGGARVELAVADGLARALVDGGEVGRLEVPAVGSGRIRAEVGGRGGELTLSALRLEEDVEYVGNDGLTEFDVPEGSYVVLGDNSRKSEDSRMWRARAIHVEGRDEPFIVETSSTDLAGGLVRNLVRKGGRVRFVDADGLPRDIAASDIVREEPPTPRPYVRREDMVGRAALVFWPVPPFGSSFRPRLLP